MVFTGVGISTESGIPDFRSAGGIWDLYDPEDFTIQKFMRDQEARKKQWELLRGGLLTSRGLIRTKAGEAIKSLASWMKERLTARRRIPYRIRPFLAFFLSRRALSSSDRLAPSGTRYSHVLPARMSRS